MSDDDKGLAGLEKLISKRVNPQSDSAIGPKVRKLFELVTQTPGGTSVPYPDVDKLAEQPPHILSTLARCKAYAKATPKKPEDYDEQDANNLCADIAGISRAAAPAAASGGAAPAPRRAASEMTPAERQDALSRGSRTPVAA